MEPGLEAHATFDPPNYAFPFGTHVCIVEVDRETGDVRLLRYVAVDDCGRQINPMIVEGQVHGAIVQGIGQALWEDGRYGPDGEPLAAGFLDYAMPRTTNLPSIEVGHTETPSPYNPLGIKGAGEGGTIAATPATVNAVLDALAPLGVTHIDMPMTPEAVWRAIRGARS